MTQRDEENSAGFTCDVCGEFTSQCECSWEDKEMYYAKCDPYLECENQ